MEFKEIDTARKDVPVASGAFGLAGGEAVAASTRRLGAVAVVVVVEVAGFGIAAAVVPAAVGRAWFAADAVAGAVDVAADDDEVVGVDVATAGLPLAAPLRGAAIAPSATVVAVALDVAPAPVVAPVVTLGTPGTAATAAAAAATAGTGFGTAATRTATPGWGVQGKNHKSEGERHIMRHTRCTVSRKRSLEL